MRPQPCPERSRRSDPSPYRRSLAEQGNLAYADRERCSGKVWRFGSNWILAISPSMRGRPGLMDRCRLFSIGWSIAGARIHEETWFISVSRLHFEGSRVPPTGSPPPADPPPAWMRFTWLPTDQIVLAAVNGAALVVILIYWAMQGGLRGEVIDLDAARHVADPRRPAPVATPLPAASSAAPAPFVAAKAVDPPSPVRQPGFTVDINTADWTEFAQLPGIGPTLAKRIIEHRGQIGRFSQLAELDDVKGIGPATMERMRPYLRPIAPPAAGTSPSP